jgi:uncharacterized repeat protein (TIGR01451 family)
MKRRFNRPGKAALAALCSAALLFLPARQIHAAGTQVISGHVPEAIARFKLQSVGHFNGTNHLKLAIGLPLRDKAGLTNLLRQISDPASPNYHHYLTPAAFAERFGPTMADYKALIAFANSNKLIVTGTHPNRTLLDIEAPAADLEKALHVTFQVYQHPVEDRTFYAPSAEPSIDLSVPVLRINGLDNFQLPRPMMIKKASVTNQSGAKPALGSGPGGTYLGYDFRAAYVPGVALTGTGQTVGLLEFDSGFYQSDITSYENLAGLPNVPVSAVLLDGYNGGPGGGNDEVSLDIEMAISMAPGLSRVIVYEGDVTDDILNRMATDDVAKQIGASWFYPIDATSDQIYQQYAAQGQSFFNASGDGDAFVGTIYPPADDPNITVVGGTTLSTTGPGGAWTSEQVWNWGYNPPGGNPTDNGYAGSGGGISTTVPIPYWQLGINMTNNLGSTTMRNFPDVALTADNIWVLSGGDAQGASIGGTSAATPLWAGFCALVNQQASANGESTQGFLNPALYAIGKSNIYTACFRDTVLGSNTWPGSPTQFYAVPGYDLATGWGTPNGSNLINTLAPVSLTPVLTVFTNIISGGNGNGVIDFDECNNLTIILTNQSQIAATGVQVSLISTTPDAIIAQGSSSYPNIYGGGAAANSSLFTLSTEPSFVCGTPVNLIMIVKSDQGVETNYITLPSGVLGPPDSFTNSIPMFIPTNGYPLNSPIQVSNLQSLGEVTVSVHLQTAYDVGLILTLVAPNGTNIVLSEYNGGLGANYGTSCSASAETIFDDNASTPIVNGTAPFVGSFMPEQPLSAFKLLSGTNLNGIWNLQVTDEIPGQTAILDCWSLNISPEVCVDGGGQCPGADLSLAMSASPSSVFESSNLVYTFTVSNAGPSTADNVLISQTLPPGVNFVMATNYLVTVSQVGSNLNIIMGTLPVYGTAVVDVVTVPTIPGFITSTAAVSSQEPDPNPANNSASASTFVTQLTADVGVTMTASPSSVLQGGKLTYTINVTNNGPFTANAVTLATTVPASANFISATTTQGTLSFNGSVAALGNLGMGTNVVVTIVVSPTVTGNIVASTVASISPSETDPITFNNSASISTTVGPAADLGITAVAIPSPVVAGSNVTYVMTVTNIGPSAATGVVISQTLPAGSTFVSSSFAGSTVSNGAVSGTLPTLGSGGSVVITNVITSPTLLPGVRSQPLFSTFTVFGQPGDPNTNNNTFVLQTIAEPPTVTIVTAGATITSGSSSGAIGPTGNYGVKLYLQNVGNIPTTNLVATLLNSNGVTLSSGFQTYGAMAPGQTVSGQYTFTANSTNGGVIIATLQLQDGTGGLGTVSFDFVMPVVQTFWNTNFISIPNQTNIPYPADGAANPYPSSIGVSNVTGDVSAVTVTVSNMVHQYPADVQMLLVGPTGENCVLMAGAGEYSTLTTPTTFTFNQSASLVIPAQGNIVAGSYQPANYNPTNAFPNSPVPTGPYNTNLSVFGSLSANGAWGLYVYDNGSGDYGAISNGWGLSFTTITPVSQVADLMATITASASQVVLGGSITNVWTVTNNGPNAATVFVTNILSSGLALVTNILPAGVVNIQSGATSVYNFGMLNVGAGLAVTNIVTATVSGAQTNSIAAGSTVLDGNPINSMASVVTTVVAPLADFCGGPLYAPASVVIGSNLVYTLYVTNNGPSNAFSVVGLFTNSSDVQVISAGVSQGNAVLATNAVQCNLGTIVAGQFAIVNVTVTAISTGTATAGWTVSTTCNDTNLANNSATSQAVVTQPIAIITNGPVILLSQASAPFNGAINSAQTNTVSFALLNLGSGPTTNLIATLLSNSTLRPITVSNLYGVIPAGGSAAQPFTFVGSGAQGSTVQAVFSLRDGINTNFAPVSYAFLIPVTQSFTNSGVITIPDSGPANPYPSMIQVSSLTNGSTNLLLSKATATLNGFSHSFPHDVEAILVSPAGQELVLMEHTGGPHAVSNLVLTFDDAATQSLSTSNQSFSGTYLVSEFAPFDAFPGLEPIPAGSTNLGYFNGMNPNGIWSLYVYDDTPGNDGVISNGWSLNLTGVSTVNPAARLVVSTIESPSPAIGGDYVNYQITVSNAGPSAATGVVLIDTIPAGTTFGPAPVSVSQGTGNASGQTVTCNLGTINVGASAIATLKVIAGARGTITNTASASSAAGTDLYPSDSISVTTTTVSGNDAPYLSAAVLSGGTLQLAIDGYAGQNYVILTSADLIHWTAVATNTGSFIFTDSSTNAPQRFYRAMQLAQ